MAPLRTLLASGPDPQWWALEPLCHCRTLGKTPIRSITSKTRKKRQIMSRQKWSKMITKSITNAQNWYKLIIYFCLFLSASSQIHSRGPTRFANFICPPPWWSRGGSGNMPGDAISMATQRTNSKEGETKETWGTQCIMDPQMLSTNKTRDCQYMSISSMILIS